MLTYKIISYKEIGDIHDASLNILRKIGIKVNHNEVFDILGDGAAVVDKKTKIVKFPEDMVMGGMMIGVAMYITIKTLWERCKNKSKVARLTGHDWKTVAKMTKPIEEGKKLPANQLLGILNEVCN